MKISQEFVEQEFTKLGFKLLDNYTNAHAHMRYLCKCGNENVATWNNFCRGHYKKTCCEFGYTTLTIDYVKQYFIKNHCILLEKKYVCNTHPMNYICECGRQSKISWSNFRKGVRCRKCGFEKISKEKSPFWNPNRNEIALNEKIRKKYYHMLRTTLQRTNMKKTCKSEEILGFTTLELLSHLQKHPNWNNVKNKKWSIDHIFPIIAFIRHGIYDPKLINCLDNLRPITLTENLSKHDLYNEEEFIIWLNSKAISKTTYQCHQQAF